MDKIAKNELARKNYAVYRAAHLEEAREKDRIKARNRRKVFADKLQAYDRERYAANKDEVRARRMQQYAENTNGVRDKLIAYAKHRHRMGNMGIRLKAALAAAKLRCAKRGIDFDLKLSDIGEPTHCAATGIEFDLSSSFRSGNIFVPSLDRIDPKLGYVRGNVRVVCHGYNLAKHTGTDANVVKLARAIVAMADKEPDERFHGDRSSHRDQDRLQVE